MVYYSITITSEHTCGTGSRAGYYMVTPCIIRET